MSPVGARIAREELTTTGRGTRDRRVTRDARSYGCLLGRILERTGHRLEPLDDWRTLAHARIEVRGHVVDIYGTRLHHTPEGGGIRAQQVRDLMSLVAARDDGTPSLLLGDCNATTDTPELQPILERRFDVLDRADEDAAAGTTLNPHYFEPELQRVVDHVFAERARFEAVEARRILDQPDASGTWPSDHFGMYARLRFIDAADDAFATP
ncbi:MAG TPA: endonuclease/exonuclease/phosphatase family protein [Woeseiaceae bacterium]